MHLGKPNRSRRELASGQFLASLVCGRSVLVDSFDVGAARWFVASMCRPSTRMALTRREAQVIHTARLGQANDEIGFALGISASTVATHLRHALSKLGLTHRSDLPAVYAAVRTAGPTPPSVTVARALSSVPTSLSPAERTVASLAARGVSAVDIARTRQTSVRTVANQLRQVYRKLSVANRTELAACLFPISTTQKGPQ